MILTLISVGITQDTVITIHIVLVLGLFVSVYSLYLLKEKERGSKGRAIYRAVGSQVTYATPYGPYRIRSMSFI